jgi:UDP-N-acetylmuramate dehydrogenase
VSERIAGYTTLRLGGPARDLVVAEDRAALVAAVRGAAGRPALILAGGSNVLIGDDGFDGTVVLIRSTGYRVHPDGPDAVRLTVEAGHSWDDLVAFTVAEGLAGAEFLSGIPGSAGGTPIQNVGAYGREVAEFLESVDVLDTATGELRTMTAAECRFGARASVFKHNPRFVVLAVTFRLERSPLSGPVRYADLLRTLDVAEGTRLPLATVREAVLAVRAGKGMVLDPADRDTYSVGSFFVNPIMTPAAYEALAVRAAAVTDLAPPRYAQPDGTVKSSSAWLIERAGFHRGYDGGHPGVSISTKHTLALTNRGGGTSAALLDLAREIRDGVLKTFEVELHPECVLVNCAL